MFEFKKFRSARIDDGSKITGTELHNRTMGTASLTTLEEPWNDTVLIDSFVTTDT